jgi:hypothetical protein
MTGADPIIIPVRTGEFKHSSRYGGSTGIKRSQAVFARIPAIRSNKKFFFLLIFF